MMVAVGSIVPGEIFIYNQKGYIRVFSEKKGPFRFLRKRYARNVAALNIQTGKFSFFVNENTLVEKIEGKRLEINLIYEKL